MPGHILKDYNMSYLPFNYQKLNLLDNSFIPNSIKNRNNISFSYWQRSLFQRACSTLEFELPENWNGNVKDFFYYCLFRFGFVAVFYDPKYGITFQPATLKGYNLYYQPTECLIHNPVFTTRENMRKYEIGSNCELIKLCPDYQGIFDIIDFYSDKLSTLDGAISMSLVNNKFAFLIGAKTKAAAESLKKMLDKVNRGEPAVIFDSKLITDDPVSKDTPFQVWDRNLKNNYITSDQLNDFQTLLNNFDAEVGIPTIPYQKKERLVTSEAESRVIDSTSRSIIWYETLSNSIEKVNNMFDTSISVKLRYNEENKTNKGDVNVNS